MFKIHIYAKQDRSNIDVDEVAGFRKLAKAYQALTISEVDTLVKKGHWVEIAK